jgi:hypothetical protein
MLPGPRRPPAKTRSAYYPVRVLADPDAGRELGRGSAQRLRLAAECLTAKPPLCQECAKTRKNGPKVLGHSGQQQAADLRF